MEWFAVIGSAAVVGMLMVFRIQAHQRLTADARILIHMLRDLAKRDEEFSDIGSPQFRKESFPKD